MFQENYTRLVTYENKHEKTKQILGGFVGLTSSMGGGGFAIAHLNAHFKQFLDIYQISKKCR